MKKGLVVISFLPLLLFSCGEDALTINTNPEYKEVETATPTDFSFFQTASDEDVYSRIKSWYSKPSWLADYDVASLSIQDPSANAAEAANHVKEIFDYGKTRGSKEDVTKIDVKIETPLFYCGDTQYVSRYDSRPKTLTWSWLSLKKGQYEYYLPTLEKPVGSFLCKSKDYLHHLMDLATIRGFGLNWLGSRLTLTADSFDYELLNIYGIHTWGLPPTSYVVRKIGFHGEFATSTLTSLGSEDIRTVPIPEEDQEMAMKV